ncbi:MAG TPA: hypothetical protein VGO50_20445 [Pyrinomonadaceae bacterium]|jgi:hypothetical protein|nr:hypothetical protein [Pyrinomonadaceae bacterium]
MNFTNEQKTGITAAAVYLLICLFFAIPIFTVKDGFWALIPLALITEFPIAGFLHILTMALLGSEWLINPPLALMMFFILLGAAINSAILYYAAYGFVAWIKQIRNGRTRKEKLK